MGCEVQHGGQRGGASRSLFVPARTLCYSALPSFALGVARRPCRQRVKALSRKGSLSAAYDGGLSWQQVQVAIVALGEPATLQQLEQLHALLERFVRENEDPKASPHLRASAPDRLDALAALLGRADVAKLSPATQLAAVASMKILCRRQDVRQRCTQRVVEALVPLLDPASSGASVALASEAANAASNLCYEPGNASMLLRAQGFARLLRLLSSSCAAAHLNAAAALQTLSFQADGRAALLKAGGPATVLQRLASSSDGGTSTSSGDTSASTAADEGKLQSRLVGVLHNISSCAEGVAALRQQGGVAAIARLLDSQHPGVAAVAAGAVQNMCLEAQARQDVREQPGALDALAALLIGRDTQAAVCAAGALASLADTADAAAEGTATEGGSGAQAPGDGSRGSGAAAAHETLIQALAAALAGAAIYHSLGQGVWPQPLAAQTEGE